MNNAQTKRFLSSLCKLIEHINKAELTKYGYQVVLNYLDECPEPDYSAKARYVVAKYVMKNIPSLEAIRQKNSSGARLDDIDHLVLKLEYEADKLNHSA